MFKLTLFLHILFTATLLGGVSLIVMFLRDASRSDQVKTMLYSFKKVQYWNKAMMMPVSIFSLLTGFALMIQYDQKPLWILLKERLGGLFLIAFIIFILTYGSKLVKTAVKKEEISHVKPLIQRYILILNISLLIMIILIFIVSFKF